MRVLLKLQCHTFCQLHSSLNAIRLLLQQKLKSIKIYIDSINYKRLLFFEVNPLASQTSVPIGKYAPFPQTLIDIEGFYVKSLNRHFLIGGDDTGCLNFIELKHDWHVCNDVTEYQVIE